MGTQKDKTEYLHIRISPELKSEYQEYCDKNGYSISKKIRLFINNELYGNEKNRWSDDETNFLKRN